MKKISNSIKDSSIIFVLLTINILYFFYVFKFNMIYMDISLRIKYIILDLIPFIIYLILFIFYRIKKTNIIKILACSLFLIFNFCYKIQISIFKVIDLSNHPIININHYKYVRINEFPKKIPKSAKNIKLFYIPGFLQGGDTLKLYYIDTKSNIQKIEKQLKNDNIISVKGTTYENSFDFDGYKINNINDFDFYYLKNHCDDSGYCNHGNYFAIAINENTNEIIYITESW